MYIKKNTRVTEGYKKMILGFVIITVLLVALILYFSASKAIIKITPKVTTVETDFSADVVTDGAGAAGEVLQGILYETEVEGALEGEATGTKTVGGGMLGKVILINKRTEPQTLVKTTRLLSQTGILLRLSDRVVIPANGQIEANVYADDPSAFTELPPATFKIPGLWEGLQDKVYAESKVTLKSVGDSVKVIKAIDIARTKDALTENLYEKAIEQFTAQLPNKDYTTIVVSKKVSGEKVSDEVDAQRDKFTVNLKMKVTLIGLDQKKIIDLAGARLQSVVGAGQELLNLDMDKLSYTVQSYDEVKKTANIKAHVVGSSVIKEENEILNKEKLAGLSKKGVELYLANFNEIEKAEVELSPFWVREVPSLKDHVVISIITPSK